MLMTMLMMMLTVMMTMLMILMDVDDGIGGDDNVSDVDGC